MTFDALIGILVTLGIGIVIGLCAMTAWDEHVYSSSSYSTLDYRYHSTSGVRDYQQDEPRYSRTYGPSTYAAYGSNYERTYEPSRYPAYDSYYRRSWRSAPPCDWECGD
jgi:hypothetical protein